MIEIRTVGGDRVLYTAVHAQDIKKALEGAVGVRANLTGADLTDAYLARANLIRANLAGANLARTNLARANLIGADLTDANLARANLIGIYLADANLARANLAGADLADADLTGANLTDAYLARAYLARANLAGANLTDANLARANLIGADLADANLARANLIGADLTDANLTGAKELNRYMTSPLYLLLDQPGRIRAYKLVNARGEGIYKGGIVYELGKVIQVADADESDADCGAGINLATLNWCLSHWRPGYRILVCEFAAKDIASIPLGTDGKFRVRRCKVIGEKSLVELGIETGDEE